MCIRDRDKAGAWFTCSFMTMFKDLAKEINPELDVENEEALAKAFKFQGQDKLYKFLNSNPKIVDILEASVKSML